jgi:hypothetical protein
MSVEFFLKNHTGNKIAALHNNQWNFSEIAKEASQKLAAARIPVPIIAKYSHRSPKIIADALANKKVRFAGMVFEDMERGFQNLFEHAYRNRKTLKFIKR